MTPTRTSLRYRLSGRNGVGWGGQEPVRAPQRGETQKLGEMEEEEEDIVEDCIRMAWAKKLCILDRWLLGNSSLFYPSGQIFLLCAAPLRGSFPYWTEKIVRLGITQTSFPPNFESVSNF